MKKIMIETNLKEARETLKMTQKEIATLLGIDQRTYSHYENGDRRIPIIHIVKLAKFYNVSSDYLLGLVSKDEARKKR